MPRFGTLNTHDQDPERAQLVQAYMILHSQQTSIRRRLLTPSQSPPLSSMSSSPSHSPSRSDSSDSPEHRRSSSGSSSSRSPKLQPRRANIVRRPSVPSIPEVPEEHFLNSDEEKLFDINKRINATLSDLLKCANVRDDERMHAWVHTRLVDAKQTLDHRRRHIVTPSVHRRSSSSINFGWNPAYMEPDLPSPRIDPAEQIRNLSL